MAVTWPGPGFDPGEVLLQALLCLLLQVTVNRSVDLEPAARHRLDSDLLQRDIVHNLIQVGLSLAQRLGVYDLRLARERNPLRIRDHLLGQHPVKDVIARLAVFYLVGNR